MFLIIKKTCSQLFASSVENIPDFTLTCGLERAYVGKKTHRLYIYNFLLTLSFFSFFFLR